MRNALTVMCAAAALALAAGAASAQSQPKLKPQARSAYDALNDVLVVRDMQELGMDELMGALAAEDAQSDDLLKQMAAINATVSQALRIPDPEARDAVLGRILKEKTGLVDKALEGAKAEAEKPDSPIQMRMDYLRLRLLRIKTMGVTRVEPYANQVLYLLDSESDREKIRKYTQEARKLLTAMAREISDEADRMARDPVARITGAARQLDMLSAEAKYNEAFMLLYEGIATPTDAAGLKVRNGLLTQAVTLVADWATPVAGAKKKVVVNAGIQQASLLISGRASRELKEGEKARGYLQQLLNANVPSSMQAEALFEIAHIAVDEGKLEPALGAIKEFQGKVDAEKLLKELAIDMQGALLTSHLYDNLAAAAGAGDPKKAEEYIGKSAQALVDFIKKYPDSMDAFVKLIERKFKGRDIKTLPLELQIMLIKRIADPKEAIKKLEEIVGRTPPPPQAVMVDGLMGLGERYYVSGQLIEAARRYRRVAEEYPKDPAAPKAAGNAVACLHKGVMEETFKPGSPEFAEYTRCLEVQQKGWGNEKGNRDDAFLLGMLYERTGQIAKAIVEFEKVPANSAVHALAKFHSLSLRGPALVNGQPTDTTRQSKGQAFVQEAKAFHAEVLGYKNDDKDRVAEVRSFGPEIDLLAAQVTVEALKDYEGARKAAQQVLQDWPDATGRIREVAEVIIIVTYLNEGKVEEVTKRISDPTKLSETIVSLIVDQLKARVDRLDRVTQKAERERMAAEYAKFMEDMYRRALDRFKAATKPSDTEWIDVQMYEYTKGLAGAMEESSDHDVINQALKHYQKLLKIHKEDAVVVRGIARCYRKIGSKKEAMSYYNQLVSGLKDRNAFWWEANAERVEYAVEINAKDAAHLQTTLMIIEMAEENDPAMGGPALKARFKKAEAQARAALAIAPQPVESRPASAPAPATAPAK